MYFPTDEFCEPSDHDQEMIVEYLKKLFSLKEIEKYCTIRSTEYAYFIYLPENIFEERSDDIDSFWVEINDKYEDKASKAVSFWKLGRSGITTYLDITTIILDKLKNKDMLQKQEDAIDDPFLQQKIIMKYSLDAITKPFVDFIRELSESTMKQISSTDKNQPGDSYDKQQEPISFGAKAA